jgi:TfoX/Sxy family transcriptional regulator of competence genes
MATDTSFVEYVIEKISHANTIIAKKMFGEYALYSNSKVVALICDNQVFVKPTMTGKAFIGNVIEAPAYPGAKPYFLIENIDDGEWFSQLIRITEAELPEPKPKSLKKSKSAKAAK